MRFIREKKTPSGAMRNFKGGESYWQPPINATLPWWEPVEDIQMPLVEEAGEKESVYEATRVDDLDSPAVIGPSGMTLHPEGRVSGSFAEPPQVVIGDSPPLPEPGEAAVDLGFPQGELPSLKWLKEDLFLFAKLKGEDAKMKMTKKVLLDLALSPT